MRTPFLRPGAWSYVVIVFAVLATAMAIIGLIVFDHQRFLITSNVEENLTAIAELKAQQVASWVSERRAHAKSLGQHSYIAREIAQWLKRGSIAGATASAIKSRFAEIANVYGYRRMTLVDAQGRPRLSTRDPPVIGDVEFRAATDALRTGNTVISDFHVSVDKSVEEAEIDVVVPVYGGENQSSPIAALICDIDPESSLHRLIETWPAPSRSAETLLVERSGNNVKYLTDLRYKTGAQYNLHLPVEAPDLIEAKGLRGQQGVVTGVDYRGVKVLAFVRPIPDTPWLMVAKIDAEEVDAPVNRLATLAGITTAIFIVMSALAINVWVRAKRESEEKFRSFSEAAEQVFWIVDLSPARIVYVNRAFERLWGYRMGELYRNPGLWKEAIDPKDRSHVAAAVAKWLRDIPGAAYEVEYRIIRPDGQVRWVADRGFILKRNGGVISRIGGIAVDITEKKWAIEALWKVNKGLDERIQSRTAEVERSHQLLQALAAVQESVLEEERKRIARELHDELAQKLTVLKLQTRSVMSALSSREPGVTLQLQEINSLLTETIRSVGQIAASLRPLVFDELGLVTALRDLTDKFAEQTGIACEFSVDPPDLSVDNKLAMPLYRMVQESLNNVVHHAEATEVIVWLNRDSSGKIVLGISDNGKGLPNEDRPARGSFGLIGIRERAAMLGGEIRIYSQPGAGTSIEIVVP